MAVIAVWQCDRDGSMFEDKKQAEEHDKYLELAANITSLIESQIPGIDEKYSEAIGLMLAQRREQLAKACKGKPDELLEPFENPYESKKVPGGLKAVVSTTDNTTPLAANA
jgi:dsDNA-binding SOS-regulon protein